MMELLTTNSLLLVMAGAIIGVFSVVIGGGMFFSIPLMQWLFPGISFGAIVGNLKVGSFFRSVGSTISTHKQIEYVSNVKLAILALIGTGIGTTLIASLSQKWLFPALVVAVLLAFFAPKLADKITNKTFHVASFLTGVYAGAFGAGIGVLLIALLRLKHPADTDIAFVKIQARFVEWLLVITAVAMHLYHGNIITAIWVPWAVGALIGGYIGGVALNRLGHLPGSVQKSVLYASFAVALVVAGIRFFTS